MTSKFPMLFPVIWLVGALTAAVAIDPVKEFRFIDSAGYTDLLYGETAVYRHVTPVFDSSRHAETFKVFHHVYGFHGEGFLTKGVGGLYSHHRGIFLGWSKIKTAGKEMDSWHGTSGASIRHLKNLPERELTGTRARRASVSEWMEKDGTVLVRDTREVTAWFAEPGKLVIDWAITISSATGDSVFLNGDLHHAGFQFRADTLIKSFTYLGPLDRAGVGDEWKMQANNSWVMSKFSLNGHGYAVMLMDHPSNPRPAEISNRDYGRFGHFFATALAGDKPITLRFRTLVLDTDKFGIASESEAQTYYDDYLKADTSEPVSIRNSKLLVGSGEKRRGKQIHMHSNNRQYLSDDERGGFSGWNAFLLTGRISAPGHRPPGLLIFKSAEK